MARRQVVVTPGVVVVGDLVLALAAAASIGALLTTLVVRARLSALVRAANRLAGGDLEQNIPAGFGALNPLSSALAALAERMRTVQADATTDRLTGLANRAMLLSQIYAAVEQAVRYERPLTVLFMDIDHFKDVNDTFGHDAGDAALRRVACIVRENVRAADIVGRYGGEELVVILPDTGLDGGYETAEKLRLLVGSERFRFAGNSFPLTVSIGVAGGCGQSLRAESLIQQADSAMYSAKAMGRNQCLVLRASEDGPVRRAPTGGVERSTAYEAGWFARNAAEDALLELVLSQQHFSGKPSPLIATIAVSMGKAIGLSRGEIDRIRVASLLHDIGKLAVPDHILAKPAPLTPEEWQLVREHPRIGQLIVEEAGKIADSGAIILHHHERFGGRGYPHGLRGIEIPIGARILAIADAYDAMIEDRPYKQAVDHEAALAELRRWAGSQFDPELVTVFADLFANRHPVVDPRFASPRLKRAARKVG